MYSHLAISGGGIKGIAIIGALSALYEKKLLDLKECIGSSVGGLICFLLTIGYTCDELKDILLHIDFSKYRDINIPNFIDNWGFDSGNELIKLLIAIIKQKNIDKNITFTDLYQKTNIKLTLTGSELNHNKIIYYNHENFPDMRVLDAVRITIGYPIVYNPIKNDSEILIDGAMFSPYPINYFKNEKNKIGIILHSTHNNNIIDTCENYLITLMKLIGQRYEQQFLNKYIDDSIVIDLKTMNGMNFNLSKEDKLNMFNIGYKNSIDYLSSINAKKASPLRSPS